MRIGLLGGAFDPPHLGHLIVAEACREAGKLDQVWFLPSSKPPHKPAGAMAPWEDRLKMIGLAIAGNPSFRLEPIENELPSPNFTFQTLAALKQYHPTNEFVLLLGQDSLADLPQWKNPEEVVRFAEIIIYPRLESRLGKDPLDAQKMLECAVPEAKITWLSGVPQLGIASRNLRERCLTGQSIRYQVSASVEMYIRQEKLYKAITFSKESIQRKEIID